MAKEKVLKIKLPQSWNELSDWQLQEIALLFHIGKPGRLFDINVLYILMNVKAHNTFAEHQAQKLLANVPLSVLKRDYYPYLYKEHNRTKFVSKMKTAAGTFYAPVDRMVNLTADEFAAADHLFLLWFKEKHRNVLQYLAAVLYTNSPDPDLRPIFSKLALERKAALFADVPLKELLAMQLVYAGCREAIANRFPIAFPKNGSQPKDGKKYGFGKVILQMAGGKFGTVKETKATDLYTFLEEFEEQLKPKK